MVSCEVKKTYKKAAHNITKTINQGQAKLAAKLDLDDRIEQLRCDTGYITVKDHKSCFPNTIKVQLINPCKPEIGKISKSMLQNINNIIRENEGLKQLQSTSQVIDWFMARDKGRRSSFTNFDVESFYPSITQGLVKKQLIGLGN